ncbi:MAG: response regulator [Vicinamibacteria bacterium]
MTGKASVFICDDHALFREGLRAILRERPELQVVGEAGDGRSAVEQVLRLRPDVVLMDLELPELSGLEATRRIAASGVGSRVVVLTLYDDEDIVAGCLDAGAAGYVLKDGPSAQLIAAIEAVHGGNRYMSPRALTKIVEYASVGRRAKTRYALLTGREREVLKLLADGFSIKEIAVRLELSVKTVDVHKSNLMRKLELHDRAALVKYAIQRKLIRVPVVDGVE